MNFHNVMTFSRNCTFLIISPPPAIRRGAEKITRFGGKNHTHNYLPAFHSVDLVQCF